MIELNDVNKFGIIEGVKLSINENDKIGLFGDNGSGKTTLLHLLTGVCLPDSGNITIMKKKYIFPMNYFNYKLYERSIRNSICFFESPDFFYDNFSIRQNLEYYMSLDTYNKAKIKELLVYFNINENMDKVVKELSRGTRQKLLVVLGFSTNKGCIIFDEPTIGLDYESKRRFYNLLLETNKTFIISTHDVEYRSFFDKTFEIETLRVSNQSRK